MFLEQKFSFYGILLALSKLYLSTIFFLEVIKMVKNVNFYRCNEKFVLLSNKKRLKTI
jgi:hypothetical protein